LRSVEFDRFARGYAEWHALAQSQQPTPSERRSHPCQNPSLCLRMLSWPPGDWSRRVPSWSGRGESTSSLRRWTSNRKRLPSPGLVDTRAHDCLRGVARGSGAHLAKLAIGCRCAGIRGMGCFSLARLSEVSRLDRWGSTAFEQPWGLGYCRALGRMPAVSPGHSRWCFLWSL
jgi:hypothetical protein